MHAISRLSGGDIVCFCFEGSADDFGITSPGVRTIKANRTAVKNAGFSPGSTTRHDKHVNAV